jgi:transposase-like protein
MSPRKLSDTDKQEIISLYKQTDETTSTLATRYGVSSSTISRFLKTNLSETEYEELIQQKRLARTPHREQTAESKVVEQQLELSIAQPSETLDSEEQSDSVTRRRRKGTSEPVQKIEKIKKLPRKETAIEEDKQELIEVKEKIEPIEPIPTPSEISVAEAEELKRVEAFTLEEMLGEDISDLDDLDDEDDLEDDDEDEDWDVDREPTLSRTRTKNVNLKVLPLSKASLPKTCYLVIDRTAELIVLPMKDFAALGSIPEDEVRQKTLPVFDNHRVARRFSHRSQRVIKVPDSQMLQKTSSHLQAKGITRLLLDGQIYSLF